MFLKVPCAVWVVVPHGGFARLWWWLGSLWGFDPIYEYVNISQGHRAKHRDCANARNASAPQYKFLLFISFILSFTQNTLGYEHTSDAGAWVSHRSTSQLGTCAEACNIEHTQRIMHTQSQQIVVGPVLAVAMPIMSTHDELCIPKANRLNANY